METSKFATHDNKEVNAISDFEFNMSRAFRKQSYILILALSCIFVLDALAEVYLSDRWSALFFMFQAFAGAWIVWKKA